LEEEINKLVGMGKGNIWREWGKEITEEPHGKE
jgi:hypothetical protein